MLVIATNNLGKIREFDAQLAELQLDVRPQSDFAVPEAAETGLSFVENAIIKARNAAKYCNHPVLADDSGLVVPALGDKPGIYSARFAGPDASDSDNISYLLAMLAKQKVTLPTPAYFYCALILIKHAADPCPIIGLGKFAGQIIAEPKGSNGFGYDPCFYIPELQQTAAELAPEIKNKLSHRAQAVKQIISKWKGYD